jgi:C4-dicarboxylate-specific signal transduction histidine kinase
MLTLIKNLASARSTNKDKARREFILNVLLLGLTFLTFVGFVHTTITRFINLNSESSVPPVIIGFFVLFFSFLLYLSKKGKLNVAAIAFITFLYLSGLYTIVKWGADVPQALLIFALIIVMGGILISTRFAFIVTVAVSISLLTVSYLQAEQLFAPIVKWRLLPHNFGDTVLRVTTLIVIMIVSWLFNREIDRALKRARASESALRKQNEDLEMIVQERTKKLQQMELDKLMQMYRFAEFGRMASGLFHDLVNHLGLVSLNLDKLSEGSKKLNRKEIDVLIERTMSGTKRLENFVLTARKQMQNQEVLQQFSLKNETAQILQLLAYKIKKAHVIIDLKAANDREIFGNPLKFSQVITNLVINAIDAYDESSKKEKKISIRIRSNQKNTSITVQDWGMGINKETFDKIFYPLFTTKSFEKGMGLGLAVCKDIMEKDFKGSITVESEEQKGTIFTLLFPNQKAPEGKILPENKN